MERGMSMWLFESGCECGCVCEFVCMLMVE